MATSSVRWLMALGVGLTLGACTQEGDGQDPDDDGGTTTEPTPPALDGDSSTGDGEPTPNDTTPDNDPMQPPEVVWEFDDVFGVPNLDNDDQNNQADWYQPIFEGEDDHSVIALPAVPPDHSVELALSGDLDAVRVWYGNQYLGSGDGELIEVAVFELPADEAAELWVEFGSDYVQAALSLRLLDANGDEVAQAEVPLRSSPMILNHHLQPTEHVWVVDVGGNASMIADFEEVLGDQFTAVPGQSYQFDVWIQDEIQLATGTGSQGQRADTVIDSIRDRGLDDFPEDVLSVPGFNIRTWGNPVQATTWDSFGNLENSPPVTVDGVEYPFGRNYYGRQGNVGLHPQMADYLISQDIQAPVELDTFWLCVGHVDEFVTFVPDPDSDKGFKLLMADVDAAYEVLDSLDPTTPLTLYGPDHGYATVGALVGDVALRNLNRGLQADELDPILAQMMTEYGLEESDVVRMPSLFETIGGCGGGTAALIPGMVNLIVANLANDESHLFIPDPFFRTSLADQSSDAVIEAFTNNLPDAVIPHYVDNWDVYHLNLGEVHCGTNMTRTPTANWWEVALHLLGG